MKRLKSLLSRFRAGFLLAGLVFCLASCSLENLPGFGAGVDGNQSAAGQTNTHLVTFDTDGGSSVEAQFIEDGKNAVRPSDPRKSGFSFVEWTLNGSRYSFSEPVHSDLNLKATWEVSSEPESATKGDSSSQASQHRFEISNKGDLSLLFVGGDYVFFYVNCDFTYWADNINASFSNSCAEVRTYYYSQDWVEFSIRGLSAGSGYLTVTLDSEFGFFSDSVFVQVLDEGQYIDDLSLVPDGTTVSFEGTYGESYSGGIVLRRYEWSVLAKNYQAQNGVSISRNNYYRIRGATKSTEDGKPVLIGGTLTYSDSWYGYDVFWFEQGWANLSHLYTRFEYSGRVYSFHRVDSKCFSVTFTDGVALLFDLNAYDPTYPASFSERGFNTASSSFLPGQSLYFSGTLDYRGAYCLSNVYLYDWDTYQQPIEEETIYPYYDISMLASLDPYTSIGNIYRTEGFLDEFQLTTSGQCVLYDRNSPSSLQIDSITENIDAINVNYDNVIPNYSFAPQYDGNQVLSGVNEGTYVSLYITFSVVRGEAKIDAIVKEWRPNELPWINLDCNANIDFSYSSRAYGQPCTVTVRCPDYLYFETCEYLLNGRMVPFENEVTFILKAYNYFYIHCDASPTGMSFNYGSGTFWLEAFGFSLNQQGNWYIDRWNEFLVREDGIFYFNNDFYIVDQVERYGEGDSYLLRRLGNNDVLFRAFYVKESWVLIPADLDYQNGYWYRDSVEISVAYPDKASHAEFSMDFLSYEDSRYLLGNIVLYNQNGASYSQRYFLLDYPNGGFYSDSVIVSFIRGGYINDGYSSYKVMIHNSVLYEVQSVETQDEWGNTYYTHVILDGYQGTYALSNGESLTVDGTGKVVYKGVEHSYRLDRETNSITFNFVDEGTGTSYKSTVILNKEAKTGEITFSELNEFTDILTRAFTGNESSGYADWSDKAGDSGVIYAGNSSTTFDSIQLRSNRNNAGIIVTANNAGLKLSRIKIYWNENTGEGRQLDIYGKNNPYTSPTELYEAETQGTLIGSFVKGNSVTEIEFSEEYSYIGLRSAVSALYISSIEITWTIVN